MKVSGEYTFEAPRKMVWEALQDPTMLTSVLPGCEKLEKIGDDEYEGALNIKIGPVQGKFQGKIKLEDMEPPVGYTMQVNGRGAQGFVKATAKLNLQEDGQRTQLSYDSDAQVGGRIASVGQRLVDSSAKAVIKQSLDGLNGMLAARLAVPEAGEAEAAPAAPAAPQPPSQAEFAATIAKEVAKDLIPKPVLIGAVILVILALLYFLL
ncbi:MAG: carbon monoxide dehydrogenase subunit G [Deltaproteobacteria bacterium]|nr:carbon monoxide dehydrogenase subunit G [Deltaproteobacteria bacterium]